jgi:hypothetical protein
MVLSKSPDLFNMIADLYVENLPMPNSIEMRNRLRTLIPPEIIEAGKTGQPLPPKPPQQDPMLELKMQELQLKMQEAQAKAQLEQQKIALDEQKLMMESHQAGIDFSKELQKLEAEKEQVSMQLKEQELRFHGEMARIQADMHKNHSQNVVKILTHQPNHFKAPTTNQQQPKGTNA